MVPICRFGGKSASPQSLNAFKSSAEAKSARLAKRTSDDSIWSTTSGFITSSSNRAGSIRQIMDLMSTFSLKPSRSRVFRMPETAASPVGSIKSRSGFSLRRMASDTSNMSPALQQIHPPATSRTWMLSSEPSSPAASINAASSPTSPYSLTRTAHFSPSGRFSRR